MAHIVERDKAPRRAHADGLALQMDRSDDPNAPQRRDEVERLLLTGSVIDAAV